MSASARLLPESIQVCVPLQFGVFNGYSFTVAGEDYLSERKEGVMGRHAQRPCSSGKKTLRSCSSKRSLDNVIVIDVDIDNPNGGDDDDDDVIVIDVPESLNKEFQGSSESKEGKKFPYQDVISIEDDETDNEENPSTHEESGGDFESDASSSKNHSFSDFMRTSKALDQDGSFVISGKSYGFKLSKCNSSRTFCGKRYGLSPESESMSSESDSSDCELMESCAGKLREQWEKAFQKKNCTGSNSQSGLGDQSRVEVENTAEKFTEAPVCSSSSEGANVQKRNQSSFQDRGKGLSGNTYQNSGKECHLRGCDKEVNNGSFQSVKYRSTNKAEFWHKKANVLSEKDPLTEDPPLRSEERSGGFCSNKRRDGFKRPFPSNLRNNDLKNSVMDSDHNTKRGHSHVPPRDDIHSDLRAASFQEDVPLKHSEHLSGTQVKQTDGLGDQDQAFSQAPASSGKYPSGLHYKKTGSGKKQEKEPKESSTPIAHFSNEKHVKNGISVSMNKVGPLSDEPPPVMTSSSVPDGVDKVCQRVAQSDVNQLQQSFSTVAEDLPPDSMAKSRECDGREPSDSHACDATPGPTEIVMDREKFKETDEYKRAVEEEWACRQRELKLQAEEAQRLRKRKKAESMRLLDMERRQKQRLEEMRESQKRVEQNTSTKEQLRSEIRKELSILELSCIDMASLLRSLGIRVDGGFHPLSNEVRAAYKRALLTFHPDRASKTDIRQQVEAEEKFKLISRMKEKFLTTSCH